MNESELSGFLEGLDDGTSWSAKCISRLLEADNLGDVAQGIVSQNGHKPVSFVKGAWNAWGIDIATCYEYCGRQNFPMVFDFPIFTSGVTNYLLPWLGLTAQLPYETGSIPGNFESFCLAVGSPMLITFSLMSTALNAQTTSKMFNDLLINNDTTPQMKEAIHSAGYFLCFSQQSPIRLNNDELQKLFEKNPERLRKRWLRLKEGLRNTRRRYTLSLFAQTVFAVVAWILTIVGSSITSLGQPSEALLLSSGTLWTWLVPVVLGWMAVGTQSGKDTVRYAINGERISGATPLKALETRSGFRDLSAKADDALWGSVQGDEACQGPAYNYARILTYSRLRDTIFQEFERKVKSLKAQELRSWPNGSAHPDSAHATASDSASSHTQEYRHLNRSNTSLIEAGLGTSPNGTHDVLPVLHLPYMTWKQVREDSLWNRNFIASNAIAVALQWGITGSAIVISYLTEVRGLGCRSGGYLLYGVLATLAHLLLLTSVFLSHHVMLGFQEKLEKQESEPQEGGTPATHKPTLKLKTTWTGRLAVLLRVCGKSIAVMNAFWIILSSIFELIGFYESCWCLGTVLALGDKAWVVLFVSGDTMRAEAQASWIGGLAMSSCTMIFTYIIAAICARGRRI